MSSNQSFTLNDEPLNRSSHYHELPHMQLLRLQVPRVYIGSFIDEPWVFGGLSTLMDAEEMDLVRELDSLPEDNVMRKINEIARRASNVKV